MGGHDATAHRNTNNLQETDCQMLDKIQRIETIKHMPNHWHLDFFNAQNMWTILGGYGTAAFTAAGVGISVMYFNAGQVHAPRNFYAYNTRLWGRVIVGAMFGLAAGYQQFGDRQKLHNAWVAERLRRRYPDCMSLKEKDLWQLKGVKAEHSFYRWT